MAASSGYELHIRKLINDHYEVIVYYNGERQRDDSKFFGRFDRALEDVLGLQKDFMERRIHCRISFGPSVRDEFIEMATKQP